MSTAANQQVNDQKGEENVKEQYVFFWTAASPFSQFYSAEFSAIPLFAWDSKSEISMQRKFGTAEQWMMFHKAILFRDYETAEQIMEESSPKRIKQLGRQVKNFDETKWKSHAWDIVYHGNYHKFTSNSSLLQQLMATYPDTLVEASPYDTIWGIGLSSTDPRAQNRSTWRGQNLLGQILTKLRNDLMQDQSSTQN